MTFTKSDSDEVIIKGLLTGGTERRNYERKLYEAYFYFIRVGVQKYRLFEEDSASAYSDSIISVIENVINGRFEQRSSLKSYAYQIFMYRCVSLIRKEATNKNTVHNTTSIESLATKLPDKARGIVQEVIAKNEWSFLLGEIKQMAEKCKQMLLLFLDGYSDKEIAGIMQYNSADVVKTSRLRCLDNLKKKTQQ